MSGELWIKDKGSVPPEGWSYHVEATGFEVTAPNFPALLSFIVDHCVANNVPAPSQSEIDRWICENKTVECYEGKQPLVNNFLVRNPIPVKSNCCGGSQ